MYQPTCQPTYQPIEERREREEGEGGGGRTLEGGACEGRHSAGNGRAECAAEMNHGMREWRRRHCAEFEMRAGPPHRRLHFLPIDECSWMDVHPRIPSFVSVRYTHDLGFHEGTGHGRLTL